MKKPTKAKATPTPKAEPEVYYGIETFTDGSVDVISTRSTAKQVEDDIREYCELDDESGFFIIVKQVKGIVVAMRPQVLEDNSIRIHDDEEFSARLKDFMEEDEE